MAIALLTPASSTPRGDDTASDRQRRIQRSIDVMRQPGSDRLSLDELAETAYYSRFHFVRSFRQVTGSTPAAFQAAIRFARAGELLLTTEASVTEICGEVGYTSLGTFSDRYREMVGVSPATYRELPHRIAEIPRTALRQDISSLDRGGCRIQVLIPERVAGMRAIYIGLYPVGQPVGVPVAGTMTGGPGTVTLGGFPPGTYHVLSAAIPAPIDGHNHLLLSPDVLVGGNSTPIRIAAGERPTVALPYRALRPTDPPILTALPALIIDLTIGGLDLRPARL
ncbi:MAG TPA: helix-turn-helix transcriptional regulator [Thermomicrobiales bacterium]|nr:helix-turn-helix transcriptional regulator [Thermomicrobiales bacterium]